MYVLEFTVIAGFKFQFDSANNMSGELPVRDYLGMANPSHGAAVLVSSMAAIRQKHGELLSTHWGRVTHEYTNIDSDNGLSPGRRNAIV